MHIQILLLPIFVYKIVVILLLSRNYVIIYI